MGSFPTIIRYYYAYLVLLKMRMYSYAAVALAMRLTKAELNDKLFWSVGTARARAARYARPAFRATE